MKILFACLVAAASLSAQFVEGRYIVELNGGSGVVAGQRQLRAHLAARGVRVRGAVDRVANALIVEGTSEAQVASLPGVRKVHRVKVYSKALDHALALMKIPDAWQSLGGVANAGAGMKIGIVDTGIDPYHKGFQDASLTVPDGFPRYSSDANRLLTNNKIIVARSYEVASALDKEGHGTAVAMIAAGVRHNATASVVLSGVAPKAYLGVYRANDADTGYFTSDTLLRAIDDAVKDGMDVINMSLGAPGLTHSEDEILTVAINRAVESGIIVVTAAGNAGPDPVTVGDTGAALNAISVGSSQNDRGMGSPQVVVPAFSLAVVALPASNSAQAGALRGVLADVAAFDGSGLGCTGLAPGTLSGKVVLVQRGDCSFEEKFNNADGAGAAAVIVYNNVDDPVRITMDVNKARLPGLCVSRSDGAALKQRLAANPEPEAQLSFSNFTTDNPDRLSTFSSRGPTLDLAIKPDLVAVGGNIITAGNGTQAGRPETSQYIMGSGTSFSAPMVAGAAALLKAARPGLSGEQYRSLLVNSSTRFPAGGDSIQVQQTGAGMLNVSGALSSTLAVSPVSLTFGEIKGQTASRQFTLSTLGRSPEPVTLTLVTKDALKPALPATSLTVTPGQPAEVRLNWNQAGAAAGEYQGYVEITGNSGVVARVPYWAGVRAKDYSRISLTLAPGAAEPRATVQILFRVLDGAGFAFEPKVDMTVVSGGGEVQGVAKLGADYPGLYVAQMQLGAQPGKNVFRLSAGEVTRDVEILGQR